MKYLIFLPALFSFLVYGAHEDQPFSFSQTLVRKVMEKAMKEHDLGKLEHFINKNNVNTKDDNGWTPLYSSVHYGNYEAAKLLIEKGADVNAKGNDGWTLIHFAFFYEKYKIAKLFIEAGSDVNVVNVTNDLGQTPLHVAILARGRGDVAKLLIEKGADVNARSRGGLTPLHFTKYTDMDEIAKLLIEKGADVNARDDDGRTYKEM